jgi:LmbE family N-acetylglucosaminyl deacetylase
VTPPEPDVVLDGDELGDRWMRVVVVAPHPDDEVLGCGGVMARHAAAGDEVFVIVATRGAPEVFSDESVERTRAEARQAHAILGVRETRFLDFPAPRLDVTPGHLLADALAQQFRAWQAERVYLPHHGDIHTDHGRVYQAALVAARPLANCPVRQLLCYETLSETEWTPPIASAVFYPTVFVDISAHLPKKLEAMRCFVSQLKAAPNPRSLETIEALARVRGSTISVPAAEAFVLVRDVVR